MSKLEELIKKDRKRKKLLNERMKRYWVKNPIKYREHLDRCARNYRKNKLKQNEKKEVVDAETQG